MHSPLSSISPSPSPSEPPHSPVQTHSGDGEPPVSHPIPRTPRSESVKLQQSTELNSKRSPPSLSAPLTIIIPPTKSPRRPSLKPQNPVSIDSPSLSEVSVSQPPQSPSSVPSSERRPSSLGPASEAEVSRLTQQSPGGHGRDLTLEEDLQEPRVDVEASPATEGRLSPTSIDSTPSPSPMTTPQQLSGPVRPTPVPAIPDAMSDGSRTTDSQVSPESPFFSSPITWSQTTLPE